MKASQRIRDLPSIDLLRYLFTYDQETGVLRWTEMIDGKLFPGKVAGGSDCKGYQCVYVQGVHLRVHRVIWAIMTGRWPVDQIDHENRRKWDNRWENLREATQSQNGMNQGPSSRNTSGARGVSLRKRVGLSKPWYAKIVVNGVAIGLGYFGTFGEAVEARVAAEKRYFGEFRCAPVEQNVPQAGL